MGEVCRNITNDEVSGNNLDVHAIAMDLENEGIELSNAKIQKILSALKLVSKQYYRVYNQKSGEEGAGDVAAEL